jgi:hypothetical protein
MLLRQFCDAIGRDPRVRDAFISSFHDAEFDPSDAAILNLGCLRVLRSRGGPLLWPAEPSVPKFPGAHRLIAGIFKLHHQ